MTLRPVVPTATLAGGTEDTAYLIAAANLLAGFSDVDAHVLGVANLTATHGTLTDNLDGTWTFAPDANYNGAVTLTYDVIDGNGGSVAAAQGFTIAAINDAPVAVADTAATYRDTPIVVPVRANDYDVDAGDVLTVTATTNGAHGTVTVDPGTGNPRYVPATGYVGPDSFTYTVSDSQGATRNAAVSLLITTVPAGDDGANTISGSNGADYLSGQGGNDVLNAGSGNVSDYVDGGLGDDVITGGAGADTLIGGPDVLPAGATDNDVFRVGGGELNGDVIAGGAGTDTLRFTAPVNLGAGFSMTGVEQLDMNGAQFNINTTATVNLSASIQTGTPASIVGNNTSNSIYGTQSGDRIDGGGASDVLHGEGGNDTLIGGAGADALYGEGGDDVFEVSGTQWATGETIVGGAGFDTLRLTGNTTRSGAVTVTDVEQLDMGGFTLTVQGSAPLDLSAVQLVNPGAITGDGGSNTITGTQGDDVISGLGGSDVLNGGLGNDTFLADGSSLNGDNIDGGGYITPSPIQTAVTLGQGLTVGNVEVLDMGGFALGVQTTELVNLSAFAEVINRGSIVGTGSNNLIVGTLSGDVINGGGGDDALSGSLGNDLLTGSGGNDTFVFTTAPNDSTNHDTVNGFEANARDKIALDPTLFAALLGGATTGVDVSEFTANAGGNAIDADDFSRVRHGDGQPLLRRRWQRRRVQGAIRWHRRADGNAL